MSLFRAREPAAGDLSKLPPDTILTVAGGPLDNGDHLRSIAVIYASGRYLVSASHLKDNVVISAAALARRRGIALQDPTPVELVDIQRAYEVNDRLHGVADESDNRIRRDITRFIEQMADEHASDIHIRVEHGHTIVRARRHGYMRDIDRWTAEQGHVFLRALWNASDESEVSYQPYDHQNAQLSKRSGLLPAKVQSLRLAYLSMAFEGRGVVIRIHYEDHEDNTNITTLGFCDFQHEQLEAMHARPEGAIILSGPTGAGKSTTIKHLLLNILEQCGHQRSAFSAEDPVELALKGVGQLTINNASTAQERGEAYAKTLRTTLRADPDILFYGEIRDAESAKITIDAAMTGHLVLTTLHVNNAISIPHRLKRLGVDNEDRTDPTIITGLVGQRLVRQLCTKCSLRAERSHLDTFLWDRLKTRCSDLSSIRIVGPGCDKCSSGYSNRSVVAETIVPDEQFMTFIRNGQKADAEAYWLDELGGMRMLDVGVMRMERGEFDPRSIEEALGPLVPFRATKKRGLPHSAKPQVAAE